MPRQYPPPANTVYSVAGLRHGAPARSTMPDETGHEIVPHALGTNCYLCLRAVQELFGDPGRIRTCDHRLRRPVLYPAELRDHTSREAGSFPDANVKFVPLVRPGNLAVIAEILRV